MAILSSFHIIFLLCLPARSISNRPVHEEILRWWKVMSEKKPIICNLEIPKDEQINCKRMSWFDILTTPKNDNSPKVLVGYGLKKYTIEICLLCLQPEIRLFVCILRKKLGWSNMVKMTLFQLNFSWGSHWKCFWTISDPKLNFAKNAQFLSVQFPYKKLEYYTFELVKINDFS